MKNIESVLSVRIYEKIRLNVSHDDAQRKKILIGLEIILINLMKCLILLILSIGLKNVRQTLTMAILFWVLRMHTFGLHAKSSVTCTMISILTHVITPLVLSFVVIDSNILYIVYFISLALLCYYSPADTENHPIIGIQRRKELKIKTIKIGLLLSIIFIISSNDLKKLIAFAELFVIIGILPITYKILHRRYRNYEKYE